MDDLRALLRPAADPGEAAPLEEVRMIPLRDIKPYWRNPRNITEAAIERVAASLDEFGWQQPIVADPAMVIIVGHTRYRAALRRGLKEAPVVVTHRLSAAQARAYRIADNRAGDYTTWKYGDLATELGSLDEFAKVLDLADWSKIIAEFQAAQDEALKLGEDVPGSLGIGFQVTVIFESQEAADRAAPGLMDVPGVLNVRHARS
jgi:hypothetical protein